MIYMIDHYDSFTYNLVQYIGEMGEDITVRRHDDVTVDEVKRLSPDLIVLSPGPQSPEKMERTEEIINTFYKEIPIFGVCLGHQALAYHFGGDIIRADELMHGKSSEIDHDGSTVFKNLPKPLTAMRYHSLIVDVNTLPGCFDITATTSEGVIMGIRHKEYPLEGVQFHPESIGTGEGKQLIKNMLTAYIAIEA
ncbi:anthranilate synthase component II [Salimicrobium flavidum]|uniref:Anthranilate synthase, component II /aminodeoxychorismate synthase, glutamine amidotransferase subunit n=1 Tax=Salimicrobium flavidum TaxID=570947 RepID=A0A1N7JHL6_9BACI|nr:aminodeoxychorismate/anthranilate synthase component II [Salimicrobium flavidum]SIS48754.1 anthranilate synthase, component II /aminodeoxychorismate synthase, glutamine amidotransferase subunit [Salimicrobium flavidum]